MRRASIFACAALAATLTLAGDLRTATVVETNVAAATTTTTAGGDTILGKLVAVGLQCQNGTATVTVNTVSGYGLSMFGSRSILGATVLTNRQLYLTNLPTAVYIGNERPSITAGASTNTCVIVGTLIYEQ